MFLVKFRPQFTPWRCPKSNNAIGLSKSVKINPLLVFNENYNYFLLYLSFLGTSGPMVKNHKVTA